jgi:hypothetical protein
MRCRRQRGIHQREASKGEMDKENSKLHEEIKEFGRRMQNMKNHLSPQLLENTENTEKPETLAPCTLNFPREVCERMLTPGVGLGDVPLGA